MAAKEAATVLSWCLICEQRPAEGIMRRVYVDTGSTVAKPGDPLPKVCKQCASDHDQQPAQSASGRFTRWEFTEEDG